jgi:branched-chain amino acid aminotransferase
MRTMVSVDGRISPPETAAVPALDRGFLYGDSVYEVLWWHRGVPIQAAEHLARLRESGLRIYMEISRSAEAVLDAVRETVAAAGVLDVEDAYVRVVVTRGVSPLGLAFDANARQTLVVVVAPAHRPTPESFERGVRVAFVDRLRVSRRALDPGAKTGNYMNNVLALHEARMRGADDAVMLNDRGEVTEGTTSNVYVVSRGSVRTPPVDAGILKGTTRTRILDLCRRHGTEADERRLLPGDLLAADEAFVSSSVRGVLPVTSIDGRAVAGGKPGPVTRRIHSWFEEAADREAAAGAPAP